MRGGIDVAPYLGSRSTFTLGVFGGHEGRVLAAGDVLAVGTSTSTAPAPLPPGMAPDIGHAWDIGVLVGPHAAPEFLTAAGLDALLRTTWRVHFNSSRTGVRLEGPRPQWARHDGGDAGLHPSNIHDTGYAIGAVDLTGDQPVILGPDGPSLGGFVCPAVVVAAERWKLGQLAPGDTVRLVALTSDEAERRDVRHAEWLERVTRPVEPVARPTWNAVLRPDGAAGTGVLARDEPDGDLPEITYRRAGDRFLLVELGPMALDLDLRLHVHALDRWAVANLGPGLVDATAGVRSLLLQVDGRRLTVARALAAVREAVGELADVSERAFPSRIVHLPLSWDDPATRDAIDRYMHGVRADAPWCPWNIEFIRRINGLDSVADVERIVFDASYLVLGLGDVYLGAPVATPLDPRHRLVTTKYNPARTWTPENAVGIGGAYLCIYGMEGPGGYQFVGRTVQVWNRAAAGPHFDDPWLLRPFDQLRWFPVSADELLEQRAAQEHGELPLRIEETSFVLADQQRAARRLPRRHRGVPGPPERGVRRGAPGVGRVRGAGVTRPTPTGRGRAGPRGDRGRRPHGDLDLRGRRGRGPGAGRGRGGPARRGRGAAPGRLHPRGEGQHRRGRAADHRGLPGLRLPTRRERARWWRPCSVRARW